MLLLEWFFIDLPSSVEGKSVELHSIIYLSLIV